MSHPGRVSIPSRGLSVGDGVRKRSILRIDSIGLLAALVVVCILFSNLSPYFFTFQNFANISSATSYIGITAALSTILIIGGGFDLSIAAVMALSGVTIAQLLNHNWPWYLAIGVALCAGAFVGLVNGFFITYLGINALIVTIGTQFVVRGLAYAVVGGQDIRISNRQVHWIGQGSVFGFPVAGILALAVFGFCGFLMKYTAFGKHVFAIGGAPAAARLVGVNVHKRRLQMYVMSGIFAAVSGVVLAGFSGSGIAYAATGMELQIIAAVILGGTALLGGRGTIFGTLLGVLFLGVVLNGMTLVGMSSYYQLIVTGSALLIAVAIDDYRKAKGSV